MKLTIRRNLIIFHQPREWEELSRRIEADYGDNILLISWRLKRELGFTVRHHKGLAPHDPIEWGQMKEEGWQHRYHYEEQVHLDFWTETQMSYFVLKYL